MDSRSLHRQGEKPLFPGLVGTFSFLVTFTQTVPVEWLVVSATLADPKRLPCSRKHPSGRPRLSEPTLGAGPSWLSERGASLSFDLARSPRRLAAGS